VFDAKRIKHIREVKEIRGKKVPNFKFTYLISVPEPCWIGARKITVDSKTSAEIDHYLI
jgi:hypothetical protein